MYRLNPVRWGNKGAGILFIYQDEILLVYRSPHGGPGNKGVLEPYTWGIPGGSIDGEYYVDSEEGRTAQLSLENYWKGAVKETIEELGSIPDTYDIFDRVVFQEGNFTFVNFLVRLPKKYPWTNTIRLNWENTDYQWFKLSQLPGRLHFGVQYILKSKPILFRGHQLGEDSPLVLIPDTLYHGTTFQNLPNIITYGGASPGLGASPHRTKTTNALFFTDEIEAALFYAGNQNPVILEVEPRGLTFYPDLDDAALLLDTDLSELNRDLQLARPLQIGDALSQGLADRILEYGELDTERAIPWTLTVEDVGEDTFLLAMPYVAIGISDAINAHMIQRKIPELYDDRNSFVWEDNQPFYLCLQFLSYQDLPIEQISKFWITQEDSRSLRIPPNLVIDTTTLDYFLQLSPGGEDLIYQADDGDPRLDSVTFQQIEFVAVNPLALREFLHGGQTFLWR